MSIISSGSEYAYLMDKYGCYYRTDAGRCKMNGGACTHWKQGGDCDAFIRKADAVRLRCVEPKLRALLDEAASKRSMVFVERGNSNYSKDDLDKMIYCLLHGYPVLQKYVEFGADEGEPLITIYEGVGRILVRD